MEFRVNSNFGLNHEPGDRAPRQGARDGAVIEYPTERGLVPTEIRTIPLEGTGINVGAFMAITSGWVFIFMSAFALLIALIVVPIVYSLASPDNFSGKSMEGLVAVKGTITLVFFGAPVGLLALGGALKKWGKNLSRRAQEQLLPSWAPIMREFYDLDIYQTYTSPASLQKVETQLAKITNEFSPLRMVMVPQGSHLQVDIAWDQGPEWARLYQYGDVADNTMLHLKIFPEGGYTFYESRVHTQLTITPDGISARGAGFAGYTAAQGEFSYTTLPFTSLAQMDEDRIQNSGGYASFGRGEQTRIPLATKAPVFLILRTLGYKNKNRLISDPCIEF
ncbi:hypothetical protein BK816_01575 [Boudabousia tangfeifanii]|uniref:Uncharacterized protein n=2 Tax=Boudabousia tangfeifanii TaxID=1912795 RepID=A0A1D9MIN8_9ACTO|nr:hypothetical protein BK816_01575 [Boudabousia tangfeifanii]